MNFSALAPIAFYPRGNARHSSFFYGRGKCAAKRCPGVRVTVGRCPAGIFVLTPNLATLPVIFRAAGVAGDALQSAAPVSG